MRKTLSMLALVAIFATSSGLPFEYVTALTLATRAEIRASVRASTPSPAPAPAPAPAPSPSPAPAPSPTPSPQPQPDPTLTPQPEPQPTPAPTPTPDPTPTPAPEPTPEPTPAPEPAQSKGLVSFNFDDGWRTGYEKGYPILAKAGFKVTYYIPSAYLEYDGFVNATELAKIRDAGNEIGSHSKDHPHLTQLSAAQLKDQVAGSKADLEKLGFKPTTFSYPYNDVNAAVFQAVKDAGYVGAAGAGGGYNDKNTDPYFLFEWSVNSDLPLAKAQAVVDEAIKNNKWVIFVIHKVDETGTDDTNVTSATLQGLVDYVKQKNVEVVTNAEGLQRVKSM